MQKIELWYPLDSFVISQGFGGNADYYKKNYGLAGHNGIDMVGSTGQIVRAAHDGRVTFTGRDGNGGWGVVIQTDDERDYNGTPAYIKSIYWHLIPESICVKPNQEVKVGDIIAKCDSTGVLLNVGGLNTSGADAASHLHFGIKPVLKGENEWTWFNLENDNGFAGAIDPAPFWNGWYAKDAQKTMDILRQQISAWRKVVELYKQLLNL